MELFVYGHRLRGLPHHADIADAEFLGDAVTAPRYALYALRDDAAALCSLGGLGVSVVGELYQVTDRRYARILAGEPPEMYHGCVVLANGRAVESTLCRRDALVGLPPIADPACWRTYLRRRGAR